MDRHSQHDTDDHSQHREKPVTDHSRHKIDSHSQHAQQQGHSPPVAHGQTHMKQDEHAVHAGHGVDHTGHEQMFRVRFWWSLLLSIPVLLYSEMIQMWLRFTPPILPFSEWMPFVFSVIIFAYGGVPFLLMAIPELREARLGRMTLFLLPISFGFFYIFAPHLFNLGEGFFWELVTL